ncbi:ferredoxin family protein [Variovorax paradoxus]|uniref:ferredoxin family protein n=1 Tax=Variovorax paradoxus TaxID=34073 RepID=UPI003D65ADC3
MTFVVTESCIACRYGDCVSVCPQNAFHEGPNFVVINPRACANCGLCEMVCPVNAIFAVADLPQDQRDCRELNAQLAAQWPVAVNTRPLDDADAHAFDKAKRDRLILQA